MSTKGSGNLLPSIYKKTNNTVANPFFTTIDEKKLFKMIPPSG